MIYSKQHSGRKKTFSRTTHCLSSGWERVNLNNTLERRTVAINSIQCGFISTMYVCTSAYISATGFFLLQIKYEMNCQGRTICSRQTDSG